ncbi:hypothetical protein DSO57_1011927 [Entomophthora muscae]|uniref:Uncharacterized protein n=1 Tax=Entomophthora muscae TaxID=34485 RepID=A0ACC2T699_9FUNG|nr:hypothetical protein DSO57_1011927 [Entomophthora muscae]
MTSSQNLVTSASKLSLTPPRPPASLLVDTPHNTEMLSTVSQFLDSEAAKWHNNLSYEEWDNWQKAAIKQFVPCKAKPLTLLCSIKLTLYNSFSEFIKAFQRLVKNTLEEQNEDLDGDEAEASTSWFNKYYGIPFLQDALPSIYANSYVRKALMN